MLKWLRDRRRGGQTNATASREAGTAMNEERDMRNEQGMDATSGSVDSTDSDGDGGNKNLSPAMQIRDRVIAVLKTVYDPEIPVDIYELGLVYGVDVTDDGSVHVTMTLTTPMCPVAETLPPEVEEKVRNVIGVKDVALDLVWDPPWSIDMLSDAARLELNLM
jgi:FeS assembly SUF system protein